MNDTLAVKDDNNKIPYSILTQLSMYIRFYGYFYIQRLLGIRVEVKTVKGHTRDYEKKVKFNLYKRFMSKIWQKIMDMPKAMMSFVTKQFYKRRYQIGEFMKKNPQLYGILLMFFLGLMKDLWRDRQQNKRRYRR